MTIGERIKQRREELNMTQEELALKAGYKSRSSINKIELSRDLPLKKVGRIATALNVTPSYLMGWEDFMLETPSMDYAISKDTDEVKEEDVPYLDPKTAAALELYEKYLKANPKIQGRIDALLEFDELKL